MSSYRFSSVVVTAVLAQGCGGRAETLDKPNMQAEHTGAAEIDDDETSGGLDPSWVDACDGPQLEGSTGAFHFCFSGRVSSDDDERNAEEGTVLLSQQNTVVRVALDEDRFVTGVAASMQLQLDDCKDRGNGSEECTLAVGGFSGTSSWTAAFEESPYDDRLDQFASQGSWSTKVVRSKDAWSVSSTQVNLVLDVAIALGPTSNLNESGVGFDSIVFDGAPNGPVFHRLAVESLSLACTGDVCEIAFNAYERESVQWDFTCATCSDYDAASVLADGLAQAGCGQSAVLPTRVGACHSDGIYHHVLLSQCESTPPCSL